MKSRVDTQRGITHTFFQGNVRASAPAPEPHRCVKVLENPKRQESPRRPALSRSRGMAVVAGIVTVSEKPKSEIPTTFKF
jgi:hypothetical protein